MNSDQFLIAKRKSKWESLDFGPITKTEIDKHINSPSWQKYRKELKGIQLPEKLSMLRSWLRQHNNSRASQVQVTNYVNALKRGGLV